MIAMNIEIPLCCGECPCMRHDERNGRHAYQCNLTLQCFTEHGNEWMWLRRSPKCPLVRVNGITYSHKGRVYVTPETASVTAGNDFNSVSGEKLGR